jgi:hypothetical protein
MAAPIVLPFNNNPASTSIKTAAYTIPSGKYARVKNLHGDLTIDTIPHYVVLQSFTRVLSSGSGTDILDADDSIDFVKATRTCTSSNAANICAASYYVGAFQVNLFVILNSANFSPSIPTTNIYYDASFTTTRTSYIAMPKLFQQIPYTQGATTAVTMSSFTGALGLGFSTARNTGTVTHSAFSAKYDKNEFWVASGTVLDGVKFLVTEYNQIS